MSPFGQAPLEPIDVFSPHGRKALLVTFRLRIPVTEDNRPHEDASMNECPLIAVVDDDESVRESLPDLIREFGHTAQAFASAADFLTSPCAKQFKCLILDVAMPGMSGPDLQRELKRLGDVTPIVFITANGGAAMRPRLLAEGAVACLSKPFSDTDLLAAIKSALKGP